MTSKSHLHSSWIIAWLSVAFLAGVALSYWWPIFYSLFWLVIGIGLATITFIGRSRRLIILTVLAGILIGLFRGSVSQVDQNSYDLLKEQEVVMVGTVVEDVGLSAHGNQELKLKEIKVNDREYPGVVWVNADFNQGIKRSDIVRLKGKVSQGFGSFSATVFHAEVQDVKRISRVDIARDVRDSFGENVRKAVSEPSASLGLGFLVGQRSTLPDDLVEKLRILGLTHIVVASGYNLTILVRFARRIFQDVSKYLSLIVGLGLTSCFILVTGFSPSMTRAGMITVLCLLAWYFGRAIHPFVLLAFSAAVTVLVNPSYLWGDLGWYLSFAAFGGVIILSPLIISYFWGQSRPNDILQILVETSSALLMTMPIIAYSFGQFAPLALLSNLLILPVIPIAMIATFGAGLGGIIFSSGLMAQLLAIPSELILGYMIWIGSKLASLPFAMVEVSFGLTGLILAYVSIFVLALFLKRQTKHDFLEDNIII